jgi:P2 family phage contractile tail tube protein
MSNLRDSNIFQDFTVWVRDIGKIGECPNFQPPEINLQVEEFRGGGMDAPVEIPMGLEKIEFDFELHTWDEQVWTQIGYGVNSMDVPVYFRGYQISASGAERGVLIATRSLIKSIKPSKVEPGKKASLSVHLSCNYYRHEVEGRVLTEIDIFNRLTIIDGVDRSARARDILGYGAGA